VIESASVIFFRTKHRGRPKFVVGINRARLTEYTFRDDDPPERSWHEIIPARVPGDPQQPGGPTLTAQQNALIFAISGDGVVTFGDVVILYMSNELTVKIPLVFQSVSQ
jgi:hypothetical protein